MLISVWIQNLVTIWTTAFHDNEKEYVQLTWFKLLYWKLFSRPIGIYLVNDYSPSCLTSEWFGVLGSGEWMLLSHTGQHLSLNSTTLKDWFGTSNVSWIRPYSKVSLKLNELNYFKRGLQTVGNFLLFSIG